MLSYYRHFFFNLKITHLHYCFLFDFLDNLSLVRHLLFYQSISLFNNLVNSCLNQSNQSLMQFKMVYNLFLLILNLLFLLYKGHMS